jgi:hypothetical protein
MELTKNNLKKMIHYCPSSRGFLLSHFKVSERAFRRFTAKCEEEGAPIVCWNGVYYWNRALFKLSLKARYKTALSHLKVVSRYNKTLKKQLQYDLFGGK